MILGVASAYTFGTDVRPYARAAHSCPPSNTLYVCSALIAVLVVVAPSQRHRSSLYAWAGPESLDEDKHVPIRRTLGALMTC
jgi:hypothetical protein